MSPFQKSTIYILISLICFQVSRILLFILYFKGKNADLSAFLNGIRFDLSVISALWIAPLLIINFPVGNPKRKYLKIYKSIFWICSLLMYLSLILMLILLAVDLIFFGYSAKHISVEILSIWNDIGFILNLTVTQYITHLILFIIICTLLSVLWIRIAKADLRFPKLPSQIITFSLLTTALIFGIRGTLSSKPIHIIDAFTKGQDYGNLSLNGAFTIYRTIYSARSRKNINLKADFFPEEKAKEILGIKNNSNPFEKTNLCSRKQEKFNLILFILESWTPEFIDSLSGNSYGVTPNFDKIANKGVVFEKFYSAGTRSIFGIQAIITGIPVLPLLPPIGFGLEGLKFKGIGEILREHGYKTIFIQSSKRRSYRIDSLAMASGFEYFWGMEDIRREVGLILNYPEPDAPFFGWDYETLLFLRKKINELGEPFASFVFTGTTHPDFPPLPSQFVKYPHHPKEKEGYLNTIFYSDWSIGEFMKYAEGSDWFSRTFFIFTSDHPIYTAEKDFEAKFRIPFVIYAPEIFPPKRIKNIVGSHYDIIPFILDILCISTKYSSIGKSLFEKSAEDFVLVTDGEIVGAISQYGYIIHNTEKRLTVRKFSETEDEYWDTLEKKLLALIQLSLSSILKNRWHK